MSRTPLNDGDPQLAAIRGAWTRCYQAVDFNAWEDTIDYDAVMEESFDYVGSFRWLDLPDGLFDTDRASAFATAYMVAWIAGLIEHDREYIASLLIRALGCEGELELRPVAEVSIKLIRDAYESGRAAAAELPPT